MTAAIRNTIWIYNDEGVSQDAVVHLQKTFSLVFKNSYRISLISSRELTEKTWEKNARLFVIGGGRDIAYHALLKGTGNQKIRRYVENGGLFLGICAGAYYASSSFVFAKNTSQEMKEKRELKFFKGRSIGPYLASFDPFSNSGARSSKIFVKNTSEVLQLFYNGGGYFHLAEKKKNITVVASYDAMHQFPVVIACKVGKGKALLSGVHFEYDPEHMDDRDPYIKKLKPKLQKYNAARLEWVKTLFRV